MQKYNICYSLDANYVEQFTVSAVSILKNADVNDNINFYVLDGGLTEKDKTNIEILKNIKEFNIEYLEINEKDFKDCPMLKDKGGNHKDYHVTLPTYFRFKLPELLPNLDKVLYLDCDVIVRTSLNDLYSVALKDKAVAMAEDVESKKEAERLGIKHYYNAGVMLINLDFWRNNDVSRLLFDYAKTNKKKILWQDQDVINVVLDEKIKPLNNKWNYQYFLYDKVDAKKLSDCSILHLAGRFKPWLMPFEHFLYDYYYSYLVLTPFKNNIVDYKQKSSGKFLKNNVGGSETNILLFASNDDIQSLYKEITKNYEYINKLAAETGAGLKLLNKDVVKTVETLNAETDVKISKIYEEITKNYEYTNELVEGVKADRETVQADVDAKVAQVAEEVTASTDEKITKVYEEITKNYEYTNELVEGVKADRETVQADVDAKVAQIAEEVTASTDEKITKVYEEITKNYEYTNELRDEARVDNEVLKKNLEEDINQRFAQTNEATDEKLTKVYEEISKNYDYVNETRDASRIESDEKITKVYEEITKNYEYTNELVEGVKADRETVQADVDAKVAQIAEEVTVSTDEKITKVYEEITKNYEYTNELRDEARVDNEVLKKNLEEDINQRFVQTNETTDEKLTKVYEEISKNYDYVNETRDASRIESDEKITKVYEEITKNYEYTNELRDEAKVDNEVLKKNLEEDINQRFVQTNEATDEKITKVYEEITKNYEYTNELRDISKAEVDEKISNVYDEISKSYDYANEIKSSLEKENDAIKAEINDKEDTFYERLITLEKNILNETDESFSLIKREITTIYEKIALNDESLKRDFNELKEIFLEKLNDKFELLLSKMEEKVASIYDDMGVLRSDVERLIKQVAFDLIAETDEKIGKVYDEISKNYDYTNKLIQENKDLTYTVKSELEHQLKTAQENIYSYVDHADEIVSGVADEKIKNLENRVDDKITKFEISQNRKNDLKISEVYSYANSELTKVFKQVHQNSINFENKLELKSYETYKNIEEDRKEISTIKKALGDKTSFSDFAALEEEFSKKLQVLDSQHQEQISQLVSDFENQLNEQRIKYENKLMNMENHIAIIEQKYIDSKKGFFTKVIEKCKKR